MPRRGPREEVGAGACFCCLHWHLHLLMLMLTLRLHHIRSSPGPYPAGSLLLDQLGGDSRDRIGPLFVVSV